MKEITKITIFLLGLALLFYIAENFLPIKIFGILGLIGFYMALFITLGRLGVWLYNKLFNE